MNLLADESVDRQIVERLRQDGHVLLYVAEMSPGISDDDVLKIATQEGMPLLTADKDFGELVYRRKQMMSGVILIRLVGLSPHQKADLVSQGINQHASELANAFTVITPGTIRIRRSQD